MSEPFIGEIRIFCGNFAPRSWAFCNGALLRIAEHTALFAVIGTTFGGDGRTNFGLPNLQAHVPMHPGNGPGLTPRRLGETGGAETISLQPSQIPSHTHQLMGTDDQADQDTNPSGKSLAKSYKTRGAAQQDVQMYGGDTSLTMNPSSVQQAGQGNPHNNMQPFLTLNFIIALDGIFPSRS